MACACEAASEWCDELDAMAGGGGRGALDYGPAPSAPPMPDPPPDSPARLGGLAGLRRAYTREALDEATAPADPLALFAAWFEAAAAAGVEEPNAMTLATATPDGRP